MRYVPLHHCIALAFYSLRDSNTAGYCRALHANVRALAFELRHTGTRFPTLRALRQTLTNGAPFTLTDLAVYDLQFRDTIASGNDPARYGL